MFTKFKKLFRKDIDAVLATSIPAAQNHTVTSTVSPFATAPVSVVAPTVAPVPKVQINETVKSTDVVSLSLKSIVARLPSSLASAVQTQGTGLVSLSTRHILQELPKGAVKISFGELRRASPSGAFVDNPRHDQMLIELPLNEILARLPSSLLTRRIDQKQINIPAEVTNVFGPRGQGASAGTSKSKPIDASSLFAPEILNGAAIPRPNVSAPAPASEPHMEVLPPASDPVGMNDVLEVGLLALSDKWPETIRQEIRSSTLGAATVLFPIEKLEPGLRSGKIVFTWQQICEGVHPRPVVADSTANLPLELPLHIIAPLFVSKRRQPKGQKIVSISDLPDLFSKTIVPVQKTPDLTGAQPFVLPPPLAEPTPVAKEKVVAVVEEAPLPREGSPNQIIKYLVAQPGITGVFIAMQDGLLVAAQLPEILKADTVAAFLPQIFGRMNQYTKELQLGGLTSLILNVENSSWQIVKSGAMYLVAIGDPKKTFSLDKLNTLAAQLAVKIQ